MSRIYLPAIFFVISFTANILSASDRVLFVEQNTPPLNQSAEPEWPEQGFKENLSKKDIAAIESWIKEFKNTTHELSLTNLIQAQKTTSCEKIVENLDYVANTIDILNRYHAGMNATNANFFQQLTDRFDLLVTQTDADLFQLDGSYLKELAEASKTLAQVAAELKKSIEIKVITRPRGGKVQPPTSPYSPIGPRYN